MRILFLILFFSIVNFAFSQDIDIYRKNKDDNIKTTIVPSGMSNKEFHLLSTNLRLKDMLYAMVVPGYVHFKANEKAMGYSILGARTLGYVGLGMAYYSINREDALVSTEEAEDGSNEIIIGDGLKVKKSDVIIAASATLIVTTYIFDWIRGDAILKRKQNRVRYKYSMKKELYNTYSSNNTMSYIPIAKLSIKL